MKMPTFDEMVRLAKTDPETLERIRLQLIEDMIAGAPESCHRRLRGLQFQIDMERRKAGNSMGACVRISKMMHDSLFTMRQTLNAALGEQLNTEMLNLNASVGDTFKNTQSAIVLPFNMQVNS